MACRISLALGWNGRSDDCLRSQYRHPHGGRAAFALDRHQRGRDAAGNPAQQDVGQPHPQLFVAGRPGNDLRNAAQHVDPLVGVAEAELFQLVGAERLLRRRLRQLQRNPDAVGGQRERRLADHEVLARLDREPVPLATPDKDRIPRRGQAADFQAIVPPADFGVLTGNAFVPRRRPEAGFPSQHVRLVGHDLSPPAMFRRRALGDEVGHGKR